MDYDANCDLKIGLAVEKCIIDVGAINREIGVGFSTRGASYDFPLLSILLEFPGVSCVSF